MRTLSLILIYFLVLSCYAQEKKIVDRVKIDWSAYPEVFEDSDKKEFKEKFKLLEHISMYELTYLSDNLKIEAFIAKPKKEGKYPVIIFNRGGNRDFGALQLFRERAKYSVVQNFPKLANEGYIIIGCNYRGCGQSEGKDEFGGEDVNDLLNLIEVISEIPEADTSRIGMYGWSRGGMMTYLTLPKTNKIKVAAVGGAPTDKTIIDRPGMETNVYSELIPDYWNKKDNELKKRSAVYFADELPKDVPILILHGNADWRVKSTQALRMGLELDKYRIPYRLKIFEGGTHGLGKFRNEVQKEVIDWFDRFLKNEEDLPNMSLEK